MAALLSPLVGELDHVQQGMMRRAAGALRVIGEDLLGEAQRRAPIEEGTLRGSGSVELDIQINGVWVTVSFATPYAARQHEETEWAHPRGGQAKYLEHPLTEKLPRYTTALGAAVGRGL